MSEHSNKLTPNSFAFLDQIQRFGGARMGEVDIEHTQSEIGQQEGPPDFSFLDAGPSYRLQPYQSPGSIAGSFGQGVWGGLMHPIQAITGEAPNTAQTMGQSIAHGVGELVGVGVSFIPFLKGASLSLQGVGLAARMSPTMFRLMEGMLAAGAYEFASGPMSEAPERMAAGGLYGIAGEAAFMGLGAAWRGRFPKGEVPAPDVGPPVQKTGMDLVLHPTESSAWRRTRYQVNPDALRVEQQLRPGMHQSLPEIQLKLQRIGDQREQLDVIAAEVAQRMRGTPAVIPGIQSPGQMIRALKRSLPEMRFSFRPMEGDQQGLYEVLVVPSRIEDIRPKTLGQKIREAFMGPGKPKLTFEAAVDFLRNPFKGEPGQVIYTGTQEWVGKMRGKKSVWGFFRPTTNEIFTSTDLPTAADVYSTLVHEYTHAWSGRLVKGGTSNTMLHDLWRDKIDEILGFNYKDLREEIAKLTSEEYKNNPVLVDKITRYNQLTVRLEREMRQLTHVAMSLQSTGADIEVTASMLDNMAKLAEQESNYYYKPTELYSRAVEVMFLRPDLAQKFGPIATDFMASVIRKEGPKLEQILTKQELITLNNQLIGLWTKTPTEGTQLFRRVGLEVTDDMLREYQRTGYFRGMEVKFGGERWEFQRVVPRGKFGQVEIRNIKSGAKRTVMPFEVSRPLFPTIVADQDLLAQRFAKLMEKPPSWLGIAVKAVDEETGVEGVRKAVVELKDFAVAKSMGEWLAENREAFQGVMTAEVRGKLANNEMTSKEVMDLVLEGQGKKGLAINDNGRYMLYVRDDSAIMYGQEILSPDWGIAPNNSPSPGWFEVSQENLTRALLRTAGVAERDLGHYMQHNPFVNIAAKIMGLEEKAVLETTQKKVGQESVGILDGAGSEGGPEHLDAAAVRSGLKVETLDSGEVRVLSEDNKELAVVGNEELARDYISRVGEPDAPDLDAAAPIKTEGFPSHGGTPPVKAQGQLPTKDFGEPGRMQRIFDAASFLAGKLTALENWSKIAERYGYGPAFTRVFEPAQKAIQAVDAELARIKRDLLGGLTFNEQLRKIEGLTVGMKRDRQETVVRALEYMSKEEVARPGGLLVRGMNENEIRVANQIEAIGLGNDVPRLMKVWSLMRAQEKGAASLEKRIGAIEAMLKERPDHPQLEQMQQSLEKFRAMLGQKKSRAQMMEELGLSEHEKFVVNVIEDGLHTHKDKFSIFAVSRYASAKPLAAGYKTGREEFMAMMKMNPKERQLVEELAKTYEATFAMSGLDYKRHIGGFWPHMRRFAEQGFNPEEEWIRQALPDMVEWSSMRFRSGELDIYSMDPTMTTYKHVRNMLMKRHLDPILPEVKEALKSIRGKDRRVHRVMSEYLNEIMGRPHVSFTKLNNMLKESAKFIGFDVPDDFVRDVVTNLTALGYGATIPFRPALIARNYYQMWQMIAPRVGNSTFFRGLKKAMTKEGYEEAVKAGVVTANVLPVSGTSELFGAEATRLTRRMQLILEKGFHWYQQADDLARAAAYHSQKIRAADHMDDLFKGRISFETFKERAKVMTYDQVDIAEFDKLWAQGNYEDATGMLGRMLSRETIFRYGHANHPSGWNSVYGRLFGQFGTWPVQYKDYLTQGLSRGTTKDRLEFAAIHGAINLSTVAALGSVGINGWSWVSFPSLVYTGGPYADLMVNMYQSIGGSDQEQQLARKNIAMMFPTLDDPRSIFVPGSYAIGDLVDMAEAPDAQTAALEGSGFRVMRPGEKSGLEWLLGY